MVRVAVKKSTEAPAPPSEIGMQLGLTGLKRSYGYVYEELLPQLQGRKAIQVYYEMSENDPVIGSTLFAIDMFMRKVGWRVEPADQSAKAYKDAAWLESCKDDMGHTWPDFISEVNSMLPYGWSWFEIIYKRRFSGQTDMLGNSVSKYNDGMVGWHKFDIRSQESWWRWDFDPDTGDILGMWQRPAPDYSERYIPAAKSLLFRTRVRKNNPEGVSVLRSAYRPWYFKKRMEEIEGIGVERDLAGLPVAEIPAEMMAATASPADKAMVASIVQLVQNVRRDQQEGLVWPQAWDENGNAMYKFSLMNSGGTRQFPTDTIITRYESRCAMTVLADFILLGNDTSTGSFALSTSKTGMFQSALSTWLDSIENVLNSQAVPRLFRLNGIPGPYPKLRHEVVQQPSLTDLATFVSAMAGAGAQLFPDTGLENHLRGVALMPPRPEDKENEAIEGEIIGQQLQTQLATSHAQQQLAEHTGANVQAEGLVPLPQGSIPGGRPMQITLNTPAGAGGNPPAPTAGGKQAGSAAGAPTRSTGKVKSKLPPSNRRSTISDRARTNTAPKNVKKVRLYKINDGKFVENYLSQFYPESVLGWVQDAKWTGPVAVNLADINIPEKRPGGDFEPGKISAVMHHIKHGHRLHPVILVNTPSGLQVADGWHRIKALNDLGRTQVMAYIGKVKSNLGPWGAEMNRSEFNSEFKENTDVKKRDSRYSQCRYCGNHATMLIPAKNDGNGIPTCLTHLAAGQADARWAANNQVNAANPAPYVPFPEVIQR